MSDDEPDDNTEDTPEAPEGQPSISPDQMADLGDSIDADDLDPDDGDDDDDGDGGDDGDDVDEQGVVDGGEWGDMYVALLKSSTNSIIEKHGDESETVDEHHFREIGLDKHFSATMEKYSGTSDMPPEQALVVGSLIAVAGPVALHTDLLSELKSEVRGE